MKLTLVILAAALCVSCVQTIPVTPIAPAAAHLQATVAATSASAKRVSTAASTTRQDATRANITVAQSTATADKLASLGTATKVELEANAKAWHEAWLATSKTVDSSAAAAVDAHELDQASTLAAIEATGLVTHAEKTDANTVALKLDNEKKTAAADKWKSLTWTFWIVVTLAILAGAAFIFLRFTQQGAAIAARTLIPLIAMSAFILPSCASQPKSVLMIGDSLTCGPYGDTMESYLKGHWPVARVIASCGSSPESWMNGHAPYRSRCGVRGFTGITPHIENLIAAWHPDTIIISLGTNHFDYLQAGGSVEHLVKIYDEFAGKLEAKTVVWVTPPDSSKFSHVIQRSVESAIVAACRKHHFTAIVSSAFTTYHGSDGVHLGTAAAHAWGAGVVKRLPQQ